MLPAENPDFTTMTPGEIANFRYALQQERKAAADVVAQFKKRETAADDYILQNVLIDDTLGSKGTSGNISKKKSVIAVVNDWPAFHKFIAENEAFELLQKREAITAVRERWDNGEEIPGLERGQKVSVHVSKAAS